MIGPGRKGSFGSGWIGEIHDLADPPALNRYENHDISVVVDRLVVKAEDRDRLADSVETALRTAGGVVEVVEHQGKKAVSHLFSERYACAELRNQSSRSSSPDSSLSTPPTVPVRSAVVSAPGKR